MAVRYLGLQSRRSGIVLRGTIAGSAERCVAAQTRVLELADRAVNMREIIEGLAMVAQDEGMIFETGDTGGDVLGFYLWEPSLS